MDIAPGLFWLFIAAIVALMLKKGISIEDIAFMGFVAGLVWMIMVIWHDLFGETGKRGFYWFFRRIREDIRRKK